MFGISKDVIFQAGPSIICILVLVAILYRYFKAKDTEWMLLFYSVLSYLAAEICTNVIDSAANLPLDVVFYFLFYFFIFLFLRQRNKGLLRSSTSNYGVGFTTVLILILDFFILFCLSYIIFFYFDRELISQNLILTSFNIDIISNFAYPILDLSIFGYYIYINRYYIMPDRNMYIPITTGLLIWTIGDFLYVFETIYTAKNLEIGNFLQPIGLVIFFIIIYAIKINSSRVDYTTIDTYSKNTKYNDFSTILGMLTIVFVVFYFICYYKFAGSPDILETANEIGILMLLFVVLSYTLVYYDSQSVLERLSKDASTDPLTGLYSRKYAFGIIHSIFSAYINFGNTITALMIDIDYFKKYNDTWGHVCGDQILRELSQLLMESIDASNIICRYGGEEFLIVLPGVGKKQGMKLAEDLRKKIESYDFYGDKSRQSFKVTVSIGSATTDKTIHDEFDLINRADIAMYKAKKERNKCAHDVVAF